MSKDQESNVTFTILQLEIDSSCEYSGYDNIVTIGKAMLELLEWKTVNKQDYNYYKRYVNMVNMSRTINSPYYAIVLKTDVETKINNVPELDFSLEHVRSVINDIDKKREEEEQKRKDAIRKKAEAAERRKLEKAAKTLLETTNLKSITTVDLQKLIKEMSTK